jgi:RimJ/RimL family protein N-acetyltransferase
LPRRPSVSTLAGVKELEEIWPLFGLRIVCGPLDLRVVRDDDIPVLVDLAERGIHPPDQMPFAVPWSTAPIGELGRNTAAHHWRTRAEFTTASWSLELVVRRRGTIVGSQGFSTQNYLVTRSGETGSWLGMEFQRQGIGTLMRQTICAFLFDHLDAQEVTSGAFTDNPASMAVSRKVGYQPNGHTRHERREGELAICDRVVLAPQDLVRPEHDLVVEGVGPVRRLIGLDT